MSLPPAAAEDGGLSAADEEPESGYNRAFWFTYAANSSMSTAISLLYRYDDFVSFLGGTELQLGLIVGLGMVGSLGVRLFQGAGIDRYGPRSVWLLSNAIFVASCLAHLALGSVYGPAVFLTRVAFQTSVSGFFGASISFVSGRAPLARLAEMVGTLGTSGFIGMALGTLLGDALLGGNSHDRAALDRMFLVAAGIGCVAFVCGVLATRHAPRRSLHGRRVSLPEVLRRYHPGWLLGIGVVMGVGLGLPGVFLRPYTRELGISKMALFFWVYTPMAFATRLSIRRFPERFGIRPMILWGMAALAGSMLLFLPLRSPWMLPAPAILFGIAHAFLFPSLVAGGTAGFPPRYRGTGTTLMLATVDLGNLIGAPLVGGLLSSARLADLPPYATMFLCIAGLIAASAAAFAMHSRNGGWGRPSEALLDDELVSEASVETARPPLAAPLVDSAPASPSYEAPPAAGG